MESARKDLASSKFAKSLKQFVEPTKRKKFSELQSSKVKGNDVYQGEKERQRDKKAARKDAERMIKDNIKQEVEHMGSSIERKINYDIQKARGIVRKRKKEDKTPRVRKRRQAEKLEKKHRTRVQEY